MLDNHYAAVSGVSAGISVSYAYDKDRLVKITHNGFEYAFAYDAIGNVLNDGIHVYTWKNGRELASITKTGMTASYTYDAGGIRTSKTVNGVTTEYLTANGSVLSEKKGSEWQHYLYHADGMLSAIRYKGADYYYVRDGRTNIIGLVDSDGNRVVSYEYDSWGKILGITGSMAGTLGQDNPYRYKGYYYDVETGFYYLQSRYYDPEIGRFVSADVYVSTDIGVEGHNMYAYSKNDPVSKMDSDGTFAILASLAAFASSTAGQMVIGATINVATSFIAAKLTGQDFTLEDAFWAGLSGAVGGRGSFEFLGIKFHEFVCEALAGVISGVYVGYSMYQKDSSVWQSVGIGLATGILTTFTMKNGINLLADFHVLGVESVSGGIGVALDVLSVTINNTRSAVAYKVMGNSSGSDNKGKNVYYSNAKIECQEKLQRKYPNRIKSKYVAQYSY